MAQTTSARIPAKTQAPRAMMKISSVVMVHSRRFVVPVTIIRVAW
jgi:hypothetical protein